MRTALLFMAVLLGTTGTAQAYIDPGTGSIVLQTLIAGLVGGLYLIKRFWHSIKAFFQRTFNRSN